VGVTVVSSITQLNFKASSEMPKPKVIYGPNKLEYEEHCHSKFKNIKQAAGC
jgi:hypothetical protein